MPAIQLKMKRLKYESDSICIEGMKRQDWEIFRDGVMNYGNADFNAMFRFIAGAPEEFMADCVGHTEQYNQTTAMMSWVQEEFLYREQPPASVYIIGHFWDLYVYPLITLTGDYSDQTREDVSKYTPEGFWPVVDRILEAVKTMKYTG